MIEPLTSLIRGQISGNTAASARFLSDVEKAKINHIINTTPAIAAAVQKASYIILEAPCHPMKKKAMQLLIESTLQKEKTYLSLKQHRSIVTNADIRHITDPLASCTRLRALSLCDCPLLSHGARHIANLTQLTSLELVNCPHVGNDEIRKLRALTNLQELILERTPNVTVDVLRFPNLKSLSYILYRDTLTDSGFSQLCKITTLKRLILGNCEKVTNDGLTHITKLKGLEILSMNALVSVKNAGFEAVFSLDRMTDLTLRRCPYATDSCLQKLPNTLRKLELTVFSGMTTKGVEQISRLTALKRLNLNFCSRMQTPELTSLSSMTNLESLSLKNHPGARPRVFNACLFMANLRVLDLTMCDNVDDDCLKSIGKMIRLQYLDVTRCFQITDRGISHLENLPDLIHLDISFCYRVNQDNLSAKIIKVLKKR